MQCLYTHAVLFCLPCDVYSTNCRRHQSLELAAPPRRRGGLRSGYDRARDAVGALPPHRRHLAEELDVLVEHRGYLPLGARRIQGHVDGRGPLHCVHGAQCAPEVRFGRV